VLQPQRKALAFAILCLGCFVAFLDIQIVSASIEEIGGGLSASPDDMSWIAALTGAGFAVRSLTYARPITTP
jgi:MFS family permease